MSRRKFNCLLTVCLLASLCGKLTAREWTDASGQFKWDGELLAADTDIAVVRDPKGKLHAVLTKELSEADRVVVNDFLKNAATNNDGAVQTWILKSGLKVRATVMGYHSGKVLIENRSGGAYINKKRLAKIDPVYQAMLPRLIANEEDSSVATVDEFKTWVRKLRGKKKELQVDGVLMKLESGDEYAVPLFMFAKEDAAILGIGWKQWNDENATRENQKQEDVLVKAEAAEYQRRKDQASQKQHQIQMMQLGLLAVDAGVTSLWEVQMAPVRGGRSMRVIVPANNSSAARTTAIAKHPGYGVTGLRQVSRR